MDPLQLQFNPFLVSPILFLVIAFLVRPPARLILLALAGGVAFALLSSLGDIAAYWSDLWYYPFVQNRYAPLSYYVYEWLIFGAGIVGLVGWWLRKRFGPKSAYIFLPAFGLLGVVRGVWEWVLNGASIWAKGPGLVPTLALSFDWLVLATITYLIVLWLEKLGLPRVVRGKHSEARA